MKKILIVDDEPAVLFALSEALADRRRGVKVATAANGNEAMAILESEKVDLMVTDLRMPEMDGFELMAWLRRSFPRLPVIVMTAYLSESARLGVGVDILEKPFDLGILKKKTSEMLRQSVKGRVENISLSSFLQLLEIERKTCTLTVTSGEHGGRLCFRGGKLVGAETGELTDQAAALEIVTWEHADIEIADGCPVEGPELEGELRFLLMEGMRLKDERERHAPHPPGIAQETDDAIEALLSPDRPAVADPIDPIVAAERAETIREALERGRGLEGSLATLLVETAGGNLVAAAIGAKGVDLEVAARATAEFARQKPRVEETIGLKDAVEEVLLTSTRRYYLLRPTGTDGRLFLLLVLDRSKANLVAAQKELAAMERELTEKALV
ncbi:MAG TPA: response regulator [Thermoanaerobaculia bacterium]|jgi:CheY-like chemotaxis protein|nr:response regulator [Thermoanaerobaculia bacterium]